MSFKQLINGYNFRSLSDLVQSTFPSAKYHLSILVIFTSSLSAQVELIFGFKMYTLVAFFIAAFFELVSGVYASVVVNKQPFVSAKFGRWAFKFILFMIGLFVIHQFGKEWEVKNPLIDQTFQWIYAFLFTQGSVEYTVSILENYAVISGKDKDFFISAMRNKVNAMFGLNSINNNNTPKL